MNPNPTLDSFVINVANKSDNGVNARIYSISGKKISEIQLHNGANKLTAKKLAMRSGIYLIEIETQGEESRTEKIIIQ